MSDARKAPVFGNTGNDSMQIHSHQDPERLRDELADFLYGMTEDGFDGGRLDEILAALDEADPMPDPSDTEESLSAFHRKYAHLFDAVEAAHSTAETIESSPEEKPARRKKVRLLHVAAVLTAMVLLGTVTVHSFDVGKWLSSLISWGTELLHVGGDEIPRAAVIVRPLEEGEEASYDTPQEALDAFGLSVPLAPRWIPERFALESVIAQNIDGRMKITASYTSDEGHLLIRYREGTPDSRSFEKEGPQVSVRHYSGLKHYLLPNLEQYDAYWQNGELHCSVNGTVSREEMIDIIKSIYDEGE